MATKGGLGNRGLSALFDDNETNVEVIVPNTQTNEVDITLIDRNPNQPRQIFDEDSLNEMAESIKTYGVLQPLLLAPKLDGRYLIVAGERRFRASSRAGLRTVPAIIKDLNDEQIQEISLIENLHREDLNAIEAAFGMRELIKSHGLKQEDIAVKIGKSRPYVTNTLRLLQLPDEIIELVKTGQLDAGHARALIPIDDLQYQSTLAKQIVEKKLSVRQVEESVKLYFTRKANTGGPRDKKDMTIEMKNMVSEMKSIFQTKVKIMGNEQKGRISIDYFSSDDLERIYALLQLLKYGNRL